MNRRELTGIFKASFNEWRAHNAPISAAALTFFIMLPLPSLLLIVVELFTVFYGQTAAQEQLIEQITAVAGPAVARLFSDLLQSASSPFVSVWAGISVVAFTIGGAIGAFAVLRDAMDVIWDVKIPKKQKLSTVIREKLGPFAILSSLGLLVIAWTAIASTLFRAIVIFYQRHFDCNSAYNSPNNSFLCRRNTAFCGDIQDDSAGKGALA